MCPFKTKKRLVARLLFTGLYMALLFCSRQVATAQINDISFHHLTVDNGLPSGLIHCIYQDTYEFMWFGTDAGLCRFDGIRCKAYQSDANDKFSLHGNHVYALNEDKRHNLWILTEQGLNVYKRATDNFDFYALAGLPNLPHVGWHILNYSDSVLQIDIADFVHFSFNTNQHVYIKEDAGKNLEYQCRNALLNGYKAFWAMGYDFRTINSFMLKNNKVERQDYEIDRSKLPNPANFFIFNILQVKDSILWAATTDGLMAYNILRRSFDVYPTITKDDFLHSSLILCQGRIWIGTSNNGFWVFDIASRKFTKHYVHDATNPKSLASNNAFSFIFPDNKGNIWMDVFAKGIDYFNPAEQKFITYLPDIEAREKHVDNFIRALAEDSSGNIWAGTYNGVIYRLNRQKQITATYTTASTGKHFYSIEKILIDDKKRVWVLDDGLNLLDDVTGKFIRLFPGYSGTFAHDIVLTASHRLLFITHEYSIAELKEDKGVFSFNNININSVYNDLSVFFTDKQNRIYVNDEGGNILVYRCPGAQAVFVRALPVHGYIKACAEMDSTLWIGTTSGLVCMNSNTFSYKIFTQKNGLPENTVYSVLLDKQKHLWVSTNKGIAKFSLVDNSSRNYTPDDGLQSNEFNTNAYLLTKDGEMWFGGIHGLNAFYPAEIKDDNLPPRVQITAMNVNDEPYYGNDLTDTGTLIKLPYSQRTVSFSFTGFEYTHPSSVEVQYRLQGVDPDWITTANPGFARYANLPAGTYELRIRAAGSNGVWSGAIKTVQLVIATPYYQTWWFAVLLVIATAAILYGWYWYRIAQIKKMQMVRNRIARDLHDDIGSSVSSIRIMTDLVKDSIGKSPVRLNELVHKIGNESQQVMDAIRDIVWTINPENDQLESMYIRMQEYAAQTLEAANIEYTFEIDDSLQHIKLSMQMRRDLYLVFKEAINNMAKYSMCTNATIKIYRQGTKLILQVKDNGKGFDINEVKKGNGLKNMQSRAQQLKANILIESKNDSGTAIKLEIPIT